MALKRYTYSDRLQKLPPYLFVRLEELTAKKRAEGLDIIDFGIGDPDLPTPEPIVEALREAVSVNDYQKYSSSAGERDLRVAVAEWYGKRFGLDIDPDTQVCVTIGSKEGIFNIAQAFVNPGELIIAPSPGYPVYSGAGTLFNEARCVKIPLREEKDWLLDVDECPTDARMLYINYPNNPTGATCDLAYLKRVHDWCEDTDTILCYDNAYSEMCYDGYLGPSVLEAGPNAIEFGSFSKTFNMTGYRLGYAVGNPDLVAGLKKCKGQTDSGAPIFTQKAGIAALRMYDGRRLPDAVSRNMAVYAERRKVLVEGLRELGFNVKMPRGTFYVWFNCGMSSERFTEKMLDLGIVVTPGTGFGESAEGYIRMTVTEPVERIREALDRIKRGHV
ncbi:MAG: aminotransferase class I/II-fold pyridoxal phosphate-dependent enzyme [Candidatus Methanomethylophilaceae archaeon]|jgi:LL-diaminopimelate aminotransferase|nr:aminotransferase class I/II-fold pyridoxal phosphate-dependent enzyme [Candidatus Methanomethylophilaceae archaeon]NLF34199.1 aminotransferase class I/II-fold pyridoxal phosphate-dependent enzyme [Thermoplasmatales archaeon]